MSNFPVTCQKKTICQLKPDEELIAMVRADKHCYGCLMKRYEDKILRYVIRISGLSTDTAQDIVQNVFLKVFVNLNEFDTKMKFSSWIYRIAHNETINNWRRNKVKSANNISWDYNEGLKNIIRDEYDVEDNVFQKMTNEKLIEAISRLDRKYRDVIVLNYIEGKSYQEIAVILKKPIGTVGTLISRAKKMLGFKLENDGVNLEVALRRT